ncbi:MAG: HAD-IC family P-type ATPase, partial [Bacteroidota bacterium]
RTARPAVDRSMYLKLGVSGFLFGNIMLFSFPEYLGLELAADDFWRRCFAYLNLLLSIPLLLYSAREYFQSAWWGLKQWRATIDLPIAIGILALFGRSAYEVLSHTGAGYFDSLAGLLFFLLIGKWFQQQFYHRLSFDRDYKSYFPLAASVIGPNGIQQLPLDQLEVGQRLLIREGQLIPADSRLLKGRAEIDYSFVTGESRPIRVDEGALVYAGGRQRGMAIELEIVKKTHQSYLVQLWNEKTFQQKEGHENMERLIQKVGRVFTLAIVLIALATLIFWLVTDASLALNAFTAVLIIACPCAVALSIPFAFGNALRLMARRGYMLKNTDSLEQMQQLTHLVFDKTGTLTESESSHWICQGELSETEQVLLRSLVHHSAHPVSRRIEEWLGKGPKQGIENFRESIGQGIEGRVDGRWLRLGSSVFVGGDAKQTGTFFMVDGEQRAVFESESMVRPGIRDLLHQLEGRYELSLLSGDDEREEAAFRRLLGPEAHLLFRQSPTDKLRYVERLQDVGERVMMIGDGLNDAGALQQADLGLVVSDRNNNFSPACDAIVEGDHLQYLARELQYARRVRWVVYISFGLALIYNFIGLGFAVQALLSPVVAAILMPASSLTIAAWGMLGSWLVYHFSKADENHLSA